MVTFFIVDLVPTVVVKLRETPSGMSLTVLLCFGFFRHNAPRPDTGSISASSGFVKKCIQADFSDSAPRNLYQRPALPANYNKLLMKI